MERFRERLKDGFRFRYFPSGEPNGDVYARDFDDSGWETVRVPHDWAAGGTFSPDNDPSVREVVADGVVESISHVGRTGALPIVGLGVYRRRIFLPEEDRGKSVTLEFDGVMWDCHVYVNGRHVFFNHYGYKSFSVDVTDEVIYGGETVIAVGASVYEACSRWYPGAGIYRNMYLVKKAAQHIRYNGIWIRQLQIAGDRADFELSVTCEGTVPLSCRAEVKGPDGKLVAELCCGPAVGGLSGCFTIRNIQRWDVDEPNLYRAAVTLLDESGAPLDDETVTFGARSFEFTRDEGFVLNGRRLQIHGVCKHHDLGSLGAAMNTAALRRQLAILKEMGVNGIRTSHNPPSPELLRLCDEMGFVVMDEFFDEWAMPKIKNGYAKYFRDHAEEDLRDVILRDRNHPSVVIWSIGNEIYEQSDSEGWRVAKFLSDLCHRTDPTRPTTAGFNDTWNAFDHHLADYVDVVGINYKPLHYEEFRRDHPGMKFIATETASCVSTRGIYKLPAEIAIPCNKHDDLTLSAYELEAPSWAYYAERELAAQDDLPYMAGEFVWTGLDYLGEPTPYYGEWPSRSSYFGAVDLAGLPKNRFYLYRSHWTEKPTLHLFPHWNWPGHEGEVVPVHVYTNYPSVELFINGVSQGIRSFKEQTASAEGDWKEVARYRLMWNETVYEPGEVKAVAYRADGSVAEAAYVRTAGDPAAIRLSADRETITADGDDLCFFTASVVDKDGILCPLADVRLYFSVSGEGELLTTDSGDQRETEPFTRPDKKALAGLCVACVRSLEGRPGTITLTVEASGLVPASLAVNSADPDEKEE